MSRPPWCAIAPVWSAPGTAALGRIHAELHSIGVTLPRGRLLTGTGRSWVHNEAWPQLRPQQRLLVQTHERLIDQLTMMIKGLDKQVRRIGKRIPAVQLLETNPGIGPFRALLIATEVEPISRFKSPKHLVSYAGLAPKSTRSGQSVRYGSIPAGANRWLRGAFVQSALRHYHTTPDSWLSLFYEEKKERLGWRVARIAAARRLARATHAMLRSGEVWSNAPLRLLPRLRIEGRQQPRCHRLREPLQRRRPSLDR